MALNSKEKLTLTLAFGGYGALMAGMFAANVIDAKSDTYQRRSAEDAKCAIASTYPKVAPPADPSP